MHEGPNLLLAAELQTPHMDPTGPLYRMQWEIWTI